MQIPRRDRERAARGLVVLARDGGAVLGVPMTGDGLLRDGGQADAELRRRALGHADVGDADLRARIVVADDAGGAHARFLGRAGGFHEHDIERLIQLVGRVLQRGHREGRSSLAGGNGERSIRYRGVVVARGRGAVFGAPSQNDIVDGGRAQIDGERHRLALGRLRRVADQNGGTVVDGGEDIVVLVEVDRNIVIFKIGTKDADAERFGAFVCGICAGDQRDPCPYLASGNGY